MYNITAEIKGLTPLRFNRFIPISKDSAGKSKMTHEEQIEDALTRSYRDDKKGFYVPSSALRACLINGGKKVKVGRGGAGNLLKAILIFDEERYYLGTDEYKISEDVVRIPPRTGARIMQYWVTIEEWKIKFSANILDGVFPANALKESIQFAGMYYGLLDGRPQLGRFELTSFTKEKIS